MRSWLFSIWSLVLLGGALSAQPGLDSLLGVWQDRNMSDSVRARAFENFIWKGHLFSNRDTALLLADELMGFSMKRDLLDGQMSALNIQAVVSAMNEDLPKALELNERVLAMARQVGDLKRIAATLGNIGIIYRKQGDLPRALNHYQQSLAMNEELNDQRGVAIALTNLTVIYRDMGEMEKALAENLRSLAIVNELDDPRLLAGVLSSTGNVYFKMQDYTHALEHHERCLEIYEQSGDQRGISICLVNIGNVYYERGELDEALALQQRALDLQERIGDRLGITKSYNQMGRIRLAQGDARQAVIDCLKGLEVAEELGSINDQAHNCDCLYEAYKAVGDARNALLYCELREQLGDSLFNEENTKKITQLQMQYEFDKKVAATRAEQEKKDAIAVQELKREKLVRNGFIGGFAIVLLFAGIFFTQRNRIGKEKKRSEELLLNILPEEVAEELKEKGEAETQLIDQVSVLFTDFKGFTAMSEVLRPKELVKDLNECFSTFDRITEKYGIEKIKTIGDAYMAAGGLPTPNTTHATDVIKAALEIRDFVEAGKAKKAEAGLPFFEVRIGVHTGPVVAGIVGVKKFQYDIWGDTVNTASRMESSGAVGQVNISEATYELVKDNSEFNFTPRGRIEAKGKGELEMYFVSKNLS